MIPASRLSRAKMMEVCAQNPWTQRIRNSCMPGRWRPTEWDGIRWIDVLKRSRMALNSMTWFVHYRHIETLKWHMSFQAFYRYYSFHCVHVSCILCFDQSLNFRISYICSETNFGIGILNREFYYVWRRKFRDQNVNLEFKSASSVWNRVVWRTWVPVGEIVSKTEGVS
jgi:hypothetical protein